MMTIGKRAVALTMAFILFAAVGGGNYPLQAHASDTESVPGQESAETSPQVIEREMQMGVKLERRKILPAILIGAAVVAGVFLLVLLVTKVKYDIGGTWDFHNTFSTPGYADSDSVWIFTPYDTRNPVQGIYSHATGNINTQGTFSVVNKKDVVFYGASYEEEYLGQFDDKKTMSGTFSLVSGAKGFWKATKR